MTTAELEQRVLALRNKGWIVNFVVWSERDDPPHRLFWSVTGVKFPERAGGKGATLEEAFLDLEAKINAR